MIFSHIFLSQKISNNHEIWNRLSIQFNPINELKSISNSFLMYFQHDRYTFKTKIKILPAVNLLKKECQAIFLLNYKIDFKSLWKQEWLDNGRPHYHTFATASIFTTIAILKRRDARAHSIFGLREV